MDIKLDGVLQPNPVHGSVHEFSGYVYPNRIWSLLGFSGYLVAMATNILWVFHRLNLNLRLSHFYINLYNSFLYEDSFPKFTENLFEKKMTTMSHL